MGIAAATAGAIGIAWTASDVGSSIHPLVVPHAAVLLVGMVLGAAAGLITGTLCLLLALAHGGLIGPVEAAVSVVLMAATVWTIATMHDAADRLSNSEELRAVLLREFRHRSRNDLNGLYGLLMTRARRSTSDEAKRHLEGSAAHALALARIYGRLEEHHLVSGDVMVDTDGYVRGLVSDIAQGLGLDLEHTRVTTNVESHWLGFERAITLGLIVNEAMMNASRHAFGSGPGHIHVDLTTLDGVFYLDVSDNGKGLGGQQGGSTGVGTRVLTALAGQLGGTLTQGCPGLDGRGTAVRVRFPLNHPGR